jgi:hypothetical protein
MFIEQRNHIDAGSTDMVRQFAGRLSLLAFGSTVAEGAVMGLPMESVIMTALMRMAVFYGLGLVCGGLAQWLVEEAARDDFARVMAAVEMTSTEA